MKFILGILLISILTGIFGESPSVSFKNSFAVGVNDTLKSNWREINFDSLNIINRMAYADTANFMHEKIYPCARCFLRKEVAASLQKVNELAQHKNLKIIIYDCYRPYSYQQKMYEIVNNPKYVAKPGKGSNHNRGAAVDISLVGANGELLDMGGAFDDFSEVSHYSYTNISRKAKRNRKQLRNIMVKAGFTPYENEWWHFDYRKKQYPTVDFKWNCD
jgi:D-alanyl-D-alanine dipeptidase